jgi:hypothetical protein
MGSIRMRNFLLLAAGITALLHAGCSGCQQSVLSGDAAEHHEESDDLLALEEQTEEVIDISEEIPDLPDMPQDVSCIEWPHQDDPGEVPVATWIRQYGRENNGQHFSIRQTPDGGYITVGDTNYHDLSGPAFWILRLDAQGEVLWQKALHSPDGEMGTSVDIAPDGGYIVAGYFQRPSSDESDSLVARLTPDGDPEWTRAFGYSDDRFYWDQDIITDSDSGFLFAGSIPGPPEDEGILVVRLDAGGGVLWEKMYLCGGCRATSMKHTSDDGYVMSGVTQAFDEEWGNEFLALKLDREGNVQWQRAYGGSFDDTAEDIAQTRDCGYVIVGDSADDDNALAIKLDGDGHLVRFVSFGGNYLDGFTSVEQTPDEGFVIGGWTMPELQDRHSWILKTDSMFSMTWQYLYDKGDIWDVRITNDTGIVAAGLKYYSASQTPSDYLVIKMDGSGFPGDGCPEGYWIPAETVSWDYPVSEKEISVEAFDVHTHVHEVDLEVIDTAAGAASVCGP